MSREPPHWPKSIRYLSSCQYHASLSHSARSFLQSDPLPQIRLEPQKIRGSGSKIVIRRITDDHHPAYGQFGLFAGQKIAANTFILDYIGEIHSDERPESDYDLSLHRFQTGESVGVDASHMGNEARFINDYRGVADKPNAIFFDYRIANSGELRMGVWSQKDIKKGQEILVSYGKSFWKSRIANVNEGLSSTSVQKQ
ncbi:SET domain protein [Dendrothele bispora CBS 962.96]|uniref:SET domain protein n=1 Tax=Dendrothele bispora (strain CBS 962.96) TaxID=1314807 RepID=A0A4S8MSW7_DENBC|nr:SET domain protein [Dendrothele bispora CBS 962.96]